MGEQGGGRIRHSSLPASHLPRADTSRALGAPRGPQRARTPAAARTLGGSRPFPFLQAPPYRTWRWRIWSRHWCCKRRRTSSYVARPSQTGRSARTSKPNGGKGLSEAPCWSQRHCSEALAPWERAVCSAPAKLSICSFSTWSPAAHAHSVSAMCRQRREGFQVDSAPVEHEGAATLGVQLELVEQDVVHFAEDGLCSWPRCSAKEGVCISAQPTNEHNQETRQK